MFKTERFENREFVPLSIAVIAVSDTRTLETDTGGALLKSLLEADGHNCFERQVVRDVRLERADRDVLRVGLAVGLDLVRLPLRKRCRPLQVLDGAVELAHRDVPMAAMPVEPRVLWMQRDALRVHIDRLANAAEVREPACVPDDGVRVGRRPIVRRFRLCELRLVARPGIRRKRQRAQRVAKERDRLCARWKR